MKIIVRTAIAVLLTVFFSSYCTSSYAQEKIPISPSVFLGGHQQAAIILDYVWELERYSDQISPSVITDIWHDGKGGLYFVAAPEPLRLYHWLMGAENIILVAVQDDITTDIASIAQKKKINSLELNAVTEQCIVLHEGMLKDAQTNRLLPTPPFDVIDMLISLPNDMVAVVSFTEGISIVNTTIPITEPLSIDPYWEANKRLLRCFELANPDISLKQIYSRNRLGGSPVFGTIVPLHDTLRCIPGLVDVFCAPIEEAEAARRKGLLMDLSTSTLLIDEVSRYYPKVQEVLLREDFLVGIPLDINPRLWGIEQAGSVLFGKMVVPQTFDELITLLYGKRYEDGWIYLCAYENPVETVFAEWMIAQYIAQYATESEPLNFDTLVFRKLMIEAARAYSYHTYDYDSLEITLTYDRGIPWSFGIQGILPPTFLPGEEPQIFSEMNVWCVDSSTPHAEEAVRFLEFQARYIDPIYAMLLIPNSYQVIRWQPDAAKLPIWGRIYAQAEQQHLLDSAETTYQEMDLLLDERPIIEPETYSFYAREMAPRLKFLFGGMYEHLDAANMRSNDVYAPEANLFCSVMEEYIRGGTDDIDSVIQELNRLSRCAYDLWHENGSDFTFDEWFDEYGVW